MSSLRQSVAIGAVSVVHSCHENALSLAKQLGSRGIEVAVMVTNGDLEIFDSNIFVRKIPNVGYGSAVNAGVQALISGGKLEFDWILVMNDDIEVTDHWVQDLLLVLSGLPASIAAVGFDEGRSWESVGAGLLPKGSAFAVRRQSFVECGGFNPAFFLYFEETEFFQRLSRIGSVAIVPIPGLNHHGGSSTGQSARSGFQLVSSAAIHRNETKSSLGQYAVWFVLTCGSSITKLKWAHLLGLLAALLLLPMPKLRERITMRWFEGASPKVRAQYTLRNEQRL